MSRPARSFLVANAVFAVIATIVATMTLWPIYQSSEFLVLVAVSIAVGSVIAIAGAVWRLNAAIVSIATVAAYFVFGIPLAIPGSALWHVLPSWHGIVSLVAASASSWKELLTITVPVGAYQALLVPAFILVLLTTVVTVTMALRMRRKPLAALPPAILWVTGILFGPAQAFSPIPASLGVLIVLIAWLAWLGWYRRSASRLKLADDTASGARSRAEHRLGNGRGLLAAALVIVVSAVAGGAASYLIPAHAARTVLRTQTVQPFDPRDYPSPLSAFRSYLEKPLATEPLITVGGLPAGSHVRIATMDTYNGVVYSVGSTSVYSASGSFTRLPGRVDVSGVRGKQERLSVTVDDYSGVWVPTVGMLEQLTFDGTDAATMTDSFYYNANSGTAAVIPGVKRGVHYRLDAIVPTMRTPSDLADAIPGRASLPPITVVPDGLDQTLNGYTADATTPGAKLEAALKALAANGYISHGLSPDEPVSRSGHGADRITQLLTDVPMVGDQEQYAVTAALMARRLGFPARVVIGFVSKPGASGTQIFTGDDISAWIQVETLQDGWVSVDPNPAVRPIPHTKKEDATQVSRPHSVAPPPPAAQEQNNQPSQVTIGKQQKPNQNAFGELVLAVLTVTGWTLLALAILAAPFLTVIVAKARRRRLRKRAKTPSERISGAWLEFADAAVDHGHEPPGGGTRSEFAQIVGGARPMVLAAVADRAVFSPDPPSSREADRVWEAVSALRHSLGASRSRWQRLVALVSIRSLSGVRRHRAADGRRTGGER